MGRVFVIELEEPVYKCKECQTHLGLPNDIISKKNLESDIIYEFSRLYNFNIINVFLDVLDSIFCVYCSSDIGIVYVSVLDDEADTYWVTRSKLQGPEGSDDEV